VILSHKDPALLTVTSRPLPSFSWPFELKFSFALLSLVLVTSCASIEPKPFRGPNGNAAYWMECSGMGRTLDACYEKADELCQRRYVIVDMVTEIIAVPVHSGFIPTPFHSIAVECR